MTEISYSEQLKWVKAGNFPAFCFISPQYKSLEEAKFNFDSLRENLMQYKTPVSEIQESWFDMNEFVEYIQHTEPQIYLTETMSMASRMKMKRAAIRTAKRRARKRFMRRMIRKNTKQLKKRAYGQVKTILRKRLTGNRPWSSIPLSSRARIDAIINKRKPILNRMIKNRMPMMQRQETQRLSSVRKRSLNNSYEIPVAQYLIEKPEFQDENEKKKEAEQGLERQRRRRERIKTDPNEFIKQVRIATDETGQRKLIMASSKRDYHKNVEETTFANALQLCNQASAGTVENFTQTGTSKKICGEIQKMAKQQSQQPQQSGSEQSVGTVSTEPSYLELPELTDSPLSANNSESSFQVAQSIFAQHGGDPEKFETLLQSYEIASRVESALQSDEDIKSRIDPDQLRQHEEVINTLKKAGMEESDIKNLLGSGTGLRRMITQYESLQNMEIGTGLGSDYVVLSSGKVKLETAAGWSGTDSTSKSDVVMIHKKYLTGKTQQEQIQSAKSILQQISEGKMSTQGMDIVGGSIKSGAARILSALPSGEGSALIRNVITLAQKENPDFNNTEQFKKLTGLLDLISTYKEGEKITLQGDLGDYIKSGRITTELQEWQQAKKTIDSALSDIFNNDSELQTKLLYSAMTGDGKFASGSIGIATHFITINTRSNSVNSTPITTDLVKEMSKKFRIRVGSKSVSLSGATDRENKQRLTEWKKKNSKVSKKEIGQALIDNVKLFEELQIGKDVDISKINLSEFLSAEQLKNISPTQRSLMEANVRAKTRTVWSILEAVKQKRIKEAFSYNSLLQYLIEANKSKELTPEEEQEIDEIMDNIQPDLVEYAKTNFDFMLKMLGVEIDSVYIEDPIDLQDYMRKPKTSRANSIYINGELNLVPVDERDDIQEQRIKFALNFLNENKKRNYRSEYDNYHSKPDQRKNRSKRNMARRWAERKGLVRKGDGKDVDHKNGDPRDNSPENLRVRSRSTNRADND